MIDRHEQEREIEFVVTPEGVMVNAAEDVDVIRLLEEMLGEPDSVVFGQTWCG